MRIKAMTGTPGEARRMNLSVSAVDAPAHPTESPSVERTVFRADAITKLYGAAGARQVRALDGVSLELFRGELVVLLGPSGSGKSTLLNILGGIDRPTSGSVRFGELALESCSERELTRYRREHVGFVFQFYNLIPSLSAIENVALVTEIATHPMGPAEALERVGLGDRLHHFPAELSGGEQQRVAIARAIAKRPDVLLCDEPTGALDSATGIVVLEALARVNETLGTTTAVITHNADVARIAHRVFRFRDGRVESVVENAERVAPSELDW